MAVEAHVKLKLMNDMDYDDDDDDAPIIFRRSNTFSLKQNQLNSGTKKSSCQRPGVQSGKQISQVPTPNGLNSIQKGKPALSRNNSPLKSHPANPKGSTTSPHVSSTKIPSGSAKPSTSSASPDSEPSISLADQSKHSSKHNAISSIKEEKLFTDSVFESHSDAEDSEDEKPLSARLPKGNSSYAIKGPNTSGPVSQPVQKTRVKSEDSDDDIPLSSKLRLKSIVGLSTSCRSEFQDKKPMKVRIQPNGSTLKGNQLEKFSTLSSKRTLGEVKSSTQSSVKRPKLKESSPISLKEVSVKVEEKVDDDDVPISQRLKKSVISGNNSTPLKRKVTNFVSSFNKTNKKFKKMVKNSTYTRSSKVPPSSGEGQKWTTLVHNGVIFPPPYKPHGVKMLYKGKAVDLTPEQEEVATMFAVMLDTDYMNKPKFKENFWNDWREILGKNHVIQKLEDCDFTPVYEWHQMEKEKKKQMTSEEKKALKEDKLKQEEKYTWAIVDGVKEKVGNFRVEPPGLFRGRGEHPKMGKLKKRIRPSDITINIGKDAPIPECPIPGESWKEIRNDNTVTWLAYWIDPINQREFKYVFLAASSSLKGQSDKEKYEKARLLKDYIQGIRAAYTKNFTIKDITGKQIAVATYLIDKLALRAGNEKDDDEADTVGCCTLKVENVETIPPRTLKFDFLGKDSIRYQNDVEVEFPVFKAIQQFQTGKQGGENLFDKLDTSKLNSHLKELMPGLTAKVFRTYNASITLDDMLSRETEGGDVAGKVVVYQHANKEVAIICNHQRSVSKSHSAQMLKLNEKIEELKGVLDELKIDLARAKKGKPPLKSSDGKSKKNLNPDALERKIAQTAAKIEKMERDKETKEDLKTVALGTSKINYLDPRITVAWCKRHEVPIEKIFNRSLLAKFAWAMDIDPSFRF